MKLENLEKRMSALNEKKEALVKKSLDSQTVEEVRSINDLLVVINEEIAEVRSEIDLIKKNTVPADAKLVNGNVVGTIKEEKRDGNPLASMEYRKAFMEYVQSGKEIPSEFRSAISTDDTGAAIPVTVINEIINTLRKRYGNLYNKVRKLNVKGGVKFPIGALSAKARWINESTVSPRQSIGTLGKVSFEYCTLEIRVAQTFLSNVLTIEAFEGEIARAIVVAYLEAMDKAIVAGSGDGAPLGILNDARVTNVVDMKASEISDWTAWRKKFFSKLPLGYRAGEFIFSIGTVDAYLETMADANGNPIFRQATGLEVNDGDAQNPSGRFFGRNISLVEPDILPDFDTASDGDVIGIYWQPEEYAINENYAFTMRRYFDEETNEYVDKALAVVDGKVLNPTGIYLIKKDV